MKNCPRCGSHMVEKPPIVIYTSNPPQWDSVMWCACGYSENCGRVHGKTQEQLLHEQWEQANQGGKTKMSIKFQATIGDIRVDDQGQTKVTLVIPKSHLAGPVSLVTLLEKLLDVEILESRAES